MKTFWMSSDEESSFKLLLLFGILCNMPGLFVDVMEVDAAQYAAMSLEMAQTNNYLQVFEQGKDYLDKPPLLFWLSSILLKVFGNQAWAFKLPSFLFTLVGIYSVFRFTLLYYNRQTAWIAALITLFAQSIFLMNIDVRTDNMLLGAVCFSIWMLGEIDRSVPAKPIHFLLAGAGIGLGMLAKGPLGLVIPVLGFGTTWILQGQWNKIFQWRWAFTLLAVFIMLLPMCIGLYMQFDIQPDKVVNGKQGVSGLRFFFWEQSFGRITGESAWKNDSGALFFVHTYFWAFFPWIIILFPAILSKLRHFKSSENISFWSFILTFLALSLSRFKLPHYIYVTVPFAAILCAAWYDHFKWNRILSLIIPAFTILLASGLFIVLGFWAFPASLTKWILLMVLPGLFLIVMLKLERSRLRNHFILMCFAPAWIACLLSLHFYPNLLKYQASSNVGKYWKKEHPEDTLWLSGIRRNAVHFYSGKIMPRFSEETINKEPYIWVLVNKKEMMELLPDSTRYETIRAWPEYPVTLLSTRFLNPETRESVLDSTYLLRIKDPKL